MSDSATDDDQDDRSQNEVDDELLATLVHAENVATKQPIVGTVRPRGDAEQAEADIGAGVGASRSAAADGE